MLSLRAFRDKTAPLYSTAMCPTLQQGRRSFIMTSTPFLGGLCSTEAAYTTYAARRPYGSNGKQKATSAMTTYSLDLSAWSHPHGRRFLVNLRRTYEYRHRSGSVGDNSNHSTKNSHDPVKSNADTISCRSVGGRKNFRSIGIETTIVDV